MHNELDELVLRQAVIDRKNCLFVRSEDRQAEAACTFYTPTGSCLLQALDPFACLDGRRPGVHPVRVRLLPQRLAATLISSKQALAAWSLRTDITTSATLLTRRGRKPPTFADWSPSIIVTGLR